eukprot:3361099-Rhodomonas_salina.1
MSLFTVTSALLVWTIRLLTGMARQAPGRGASEPEAQLQVLILKCPNTHFLHSDNYYRDDNAESKEPQGCRHPHEPKA